MILRHSFYSGKSRGQDLHSAIGTGNVCPKFPLHLVRISFHSDGVRLIVTLDHKLYGLALSSQIPLFVFYLPLGNVWMGIMTGHGSRVIGLRLEQKINVNKKKLAWCW